MNRQKKKSYKGCYFSDFRKNYIAVLDEYDDNILSVIIVNPEDKEIKYAEILSGKVAPVNTAYVEIGRETFMVEFEATMSAIKEMLEEESKCK